MRWLITRLLIAASIILFFCGSAAAQTDAEQESLAMVVGDAMLPLQRVAGQFDPAPGFQLCGGFFLKSAVGADTLVFFVTAFADDDFDDAVRLPLDRLTVREEPHGRVPQAQLRYSGGPVTATLWVPSTELAACPCLKERVIASLR